ncbi:hypothetical protein [Psychrobacter sanguinis]|uniref:DUF4156 domain-containing protein n=1 Tax=Psychrobacter sanguinis TaxID=861445 RepID=A0A844M1H0_9GAMM|nr:hypothetical protein [Psychrobacter sanguinis]MUG32801.1 hypothetical protein [Psychrobacter sanguinis]
MTTLAWKKITKLTTLGVLASAAIGLSACQSTPTAPVIQRADSTFETTGVGSTKVQAQENALASAKKTCGMRQAIIVKDELKYNGVFDEKTGRMIDQVGSITGVVLGTGKPNLSRSDDFEYNISFRCQ